MTNRVNVIPILYMYLCWLGTFPESIVQQKTTQSFMGGLGWVGGGPNYVDTPTRVEVELG